MKVSAIIIPGLLCLTPAAISAQTVSDAQIASIVVTANQVDIDAGEEHPGLPFRHVPSRAIQT